jgi:BASS family bile acid:Na+ symporter
MPLTAFAITRIFYSGGDWDPAILAGIILVGSVPSGLASNVMVFIAKGNMPLSITMTAVSTAMAPIMTPFLMRTLANTYIDVNFMDMMLSTMHMVILPIIAGFVFNIFYNMNESKKSLNAQLLSYLGIIVLVGGLMMTQGTSLGDAFARTFRSFITFMVVPCAGAALMRMYFKGNREVVSKILSYFSTVGIAVIVTVTTAAGRDALLAVGFLLVLTNFIHNVTGYSLGYLFAKLFGMDERDCRTIAFETGMQNGGMASGLAAGMGKIATVGLAPAVWGPIMNTTGSILASWWGANPPKEKRDVVKEDSSDSGLKI